MPMKMGIHRKPIGHGCSAFLDSRLRRNEGGMLFSRKLFKEGSAKRSPP